MDNNQQQMAHTALMAGVVGQVGCGTVILIGLAFGVGFWLDITFETKPLFTMIFLIGSVPITMYAIVKLTMAAVQRSQRLSNNSEEVSSE